MIMKTIFAVGWRNTRGIFLLLTFGFFFIALPYYGIPGYLQTRTDYTKQVREEYRKQEEMLQGKVGGWLQEHPEAEEAKKQEVQKLMEQMEDSFAGLIRARGDGNWREELTYAIEQAQTELALCEMGVLNSDMRELQENIVWNQYLLEQNIQPKVPANASDGLNVLVMSSRLLVPLIISIGSLLFGIFQFLTERRQGGMKVLLQTPVSRRKMLICKAGLAWIQAWGLVVLVTGGMFLFFALVVGVGDGRYPAVYVNGAFLTTKEFLLKAFPAFLCAAGFFAMAGIFLAIWIRKEEVLLLCVFGIPLLALVLQKAAGLNWIGLLLLTSNVAQVLAEKPESVLRVGMGWIVLATSCLLIGIWGFEKKDMV